MDKKKSQLFVLIMFLLGIFIGAMDTGIVSPARAVVASSFGIGADTSIWMITIYTLAYAVSMPISGKLSDRYGKKKLFIYSIVIFGVGSTLCGLSDFFGSYNMLLTSRVIQAIGGGGIMPIATAYIGSSFPLEKRGTALGLVGAIYGVATTLGPTIGSAILDMVGNSNWGVLFFINVPICIIVLIMSLTIKETDKNTSTKKMDIKGSFSIAILILSLMYALTNLNFHDFIGSIKSTDVYPYLIIFVVMLPIFILIERKADDPVLNLSYFKDRNIAITLFLSFVVGCGLMGIVFVPQFGENVLKIQTGSGGYLVTVMAIFSGLAAPIGGKIIDKYSAKVILVLGFSMTIIGTLTMALCVAKTNSIVALFAGLIIMGIGMGFTMGTPLNYLMQSYVDKSEVSSAQATLSLVRSIGVAISPNILVQFVSQAGKDMPSKLMAVMPAIPGAPAGASLATMSGGSLPADTLTSLQSADVTTIVSTLKNFASTVIDSMSSTIIKSMGQLPANVTADSIITKMKTEYLASIDAVKTTIESTFQQTLNNGFAQLFIAAAIIAAFGLVFSLLLKKNQKAVE